MSHKTSDICRICASELNLMPIFQGGQELLEKLRLCANITIDFDDNLPKHICIKCEQGLSFSYRLRKQGEALESQLRQRLANNIGNDVEDVEAELQEFRVENMSRGDDDDVQIIEVPTNNTAPKVRTTARRIPVKEKPLQAFTPEDREVKIINKKGIQVPEDDVQIIEFVPDAKISESNCSQSEIIVCDGKTSTLSNHMHASRSSSSPVQDDDVQVIADIPISIEAHKFLNERTRSSDREKDDAEIIEAFRPLEEFMATTDVDLEVLNPEVKDEVIQIGVDKFMTEQSADGYQNQSEVVETFAPIGENVATTIAPDYAVIHQDDVDITSLGDMTIKGADSLLTEDVINIDDDDELVEEYADGETVTSSESSDILEENIECETLEKYNIDIVENIELDDSNDSDFYRNEENTAMSDYNINLFKNRKHLKISMIYKCDTCAECFNHQVDYRKHIKVHGRERYNCIQCSKWFPSRYRLQQHERTHSEEVEIHRCAHCPNIYRHRQNLQRHIRSVHTSENIYHCEVCTEAFNRIDVLRNHMLKHVTDRNYKCELCSKSFKSMLYLVGHMKTHNRQTENVKQPNSEQTATSADNSDPSKTVAPKRTYTCCYCGKISAHHFAHKNHLRTHTLERPYACEHCEKKFRTMAAKITHERIHNDLRPYQCDRCLVSFRQPSHLKEHKLIHDGIMPHVCSVCNMAFNRKSNLKVHMRIHTGERPYKCAEIDCGQQFMKLAQLKRHAAQAHSRDVDVVPDDEDGGEEDNETTSADDTAEEENNDQNVCNQMEMENGCLPSNLDVGNESQYNSLYILDDES